MKCLSLSLSFLTIGLTIASTTAMPSVRSRELYAVRHELSMAKLLKGKCCECGGQFEFPAEAVGTTADCPHCGRLTKLLLALPPQERTVPVKTVIFTGIAILILIGGLVAVMIALKRAERLSGRNSPPPAATAPTPAKNR